MRTLALGAAALATTLPLTACAGDRSGPAATTATTSAATAGTAHDAADVAFLERLTAHDQQALELTALVGRRTADPRLAALAERIAGALRLEVQGLRAQLLQWEVAEPGTYPDPPGHADDATVTALTAASGPGFDTRWLRAMIAHDRGAITLAQAEITGGTSADTVAMARTVAAARQAELGELTALAGPA